MQTRYHQLLRSIYDSRLAYEEEIGSRHARVADRLVASVKVAEGMRALDVCTGTGLVARRVAARVGDSGAVVGIDISKVMLEQAQQNSKTRAIQNIEFVVGDANSMSFESCSFDLVFCCEALVLLDDHLQQLQAWNRLLRPAGVVAFTCTHESSYFAQYLQLALKDVLVVPTEQGSPSSLSTN